MTYYFISLIEMLHLLGAVQGLAGVSTCFVETLALGALVGLLGRPTGARLKGWWELFWDPPDFI